MERIEELMQIRKKREFSEIESKEFDSLLNQDMDEIDTIIQDEKKKTDDFLKFSNYQGKDKIISSHDAEEHIRICNRTNIITYKSELPMLDRLTGGFEPGELIVISGMQKNGKTLFAQTLTYNFSVQEIPCCWFSYEMPMRSFLARYGNNTPLFYLPQKLLDVTLHWIEERIIESIVKYKTKIAFIDHLHYLVPLKQMTNVSLVIGGIMRELKKIAIRNEIVLFLLAHTQKIRHDEIPDLVNLRDSSFIAQESDTVMIIKRCGKITDGAAEYSREAMLYLLANRRTGDLGVVKISYDSNLRRFVEVYNGGNL
jgi:replicative DNA helicase